MEVFTVVQFKFTSITWNFLLSVWLEFKCFWSILTNIIPVMLQKYCSSPPLCWKLSNSLIYYWNTNQIQLKHFEYELFTKE